ncbi:MAG: co-chaperone GroES [Clostridiales bacterium]
MKFTPLGDRALVKVAEVEEKTQGGLIVADSAKERPQEAEVLAVGKGRLLDNGSYAPMEVAVGQKIIFAKYAGVEVKDGDDAYLLLEGREIFAVID